MSDPDVQPTGRPNARLRQTVWDMVRSMAVVLVVVGLMVLLAWRPQPDAVKVVDAAPVIAMAAAQAEFPVSAPSGLSSGWRPTSARWEATEKSAGVPALHVGYVTPSDEYAQVVQSAARTPLFRDEQTGGGRPTGTMDIGSRSWETWQAGDRRSLVLGVGPAVVIVSGSADWEELSALAASLTPTAVS